MIRWYANKTTGKRTWFYETLVYSPSVVETMLYNIAMYRKIRNKYTYISICGYDGKAVASIRVEDSDLHNLDNVRYISRLVLYASAYKIKITSFNTINIIPVQL